MLQQEHEKCEATAKVTAHACVLVVVLRGDVPGCCFRAFFVLTRNAIDTLCVRLSPERDPF